MQKMQQNPMSEVLNQGTEKIGKNWTLRSLTEMRCQWEFFVTATKFLRQILSSLNHYTVSLEQGTNLFLLMHVKPEYDCCQWY